MNAGFAKVDITPRVGVELCGFGPFLNRHSTSIRDRLYAKAMAVSDTTRTAVVVSCDLIGLSKSIVDAARSQIASAVNVPETAIVLHCTHTHSGPATTDLIGWGDVDLPYVERLPGLIAAAGIEAVRRWQPATLSHAVVPCEGIGLNREYDRDAPPLDEVIRDDWRPAKPELTDTTCHVLKFASMQGDVIGFAAYLGCHPVVCCQQTHAIHGDFVGVAMNRIAEELPGSVGLFLQGAQGDVNSCVVHKGEAESLAALDVIAERFARAVRNGLSSARQVSVDEVRVATHKVAVSRKPVSWSQLEALLAEKLAVVRNAQVSDDDYAVRLATVFVQSIRRMLAKIDAGESLTPATELQAVRVGPVTLLATPFEMFQAIKNDIVTAAKSEIPLVLGCSNELLGYAPDRTVAARGGYAADQVPIMLGRLAYANIHDELVRYVLECELQVLQQ